MNKTPLTCHADAVLTAADTSATDPASEAAAVPCCQGYHNFLENGHFQIPRSRHYRSTAACHAPVADLQPSTMGITDAEPVQNSSTAAKEHARVPAQFAVPGASRRAVPGTNRRAVSGASQHAVPDSPVALCLEAAAVSTKHVEGPQAASEVLTDGQLQPNMAAMPFANDHCCQEVHAAVQMQTLLPSRKLLFLSILCTSLRALHKVVAGTAV